MEKAQAAINLQNRKKWVTNQCTWTISKNEKEQFTIAQAVRIYTQDIGMEFSIENCAVQIIRRL